MANRMSTSSIASDRSKRWSLPALQPLDTTKSDNTSGSRATSNRPNNRNNRGSISGTSYGKSDFGVQITPAQSSGGDRRQSLNDKRMSRRISRISKLSDVSEVESQRTTSRAMSMSNASEDFRRMSRRMSVADHLADDAERRRSRRVSMMSVQSATGGRISLMTRTLAWQQNPDTLQKNVPWDDDLKKPCNWDTQKKVINTAVCSAIALCYTISLSVYAAATPTQVAIMGLTPIMAVLPYSLFALGFALGPALATPFERAYGRKIVLLATIPFYALLILGAGISKNIAGLAVCRFLAGAFAAPGLFLTYAVMGDLWINTYYTLGMATYVCSMILGLAAGPIVGGIVVEYESWKWTSWVAEFAVVVLLFAAAGMSETQKEAIKRRIKTPEQIEKEIQERRNHRVTRQPSRLHFKGNMMFSAPFKMLMSAPALSMTTLYMAYTIAILVVLPVIVFPAFGKQYNFNSEKKGFAFIGTSVGVIIAFVILFFTDVYVHQPRVWAWEVEQDPENEQGRPEMVGGPTGRAHPSWRKGLAVSTRNLGIRRSNATTNDDASRSNSNASSRLSGSGLSQGSQSRRSSREARKSRLQAFSERNINIAIAVTRFLNSQPANADRKIIVERVMVLLKNTESFTTISASLQELGLQFEEALLAKVVSDALGKEKGGEQIGLARSRSLHRLSAQAALMGGPEDGDSSSLAPVQSAAPSQPPSPTDEKSPDSPRLCPPPEWRWLPSLLASILLPGGLLMTAWTTRSSMSFIIPCIGLGMVGCGGALIAFSAIAYMLELHEDSFEATAARAGSTILSFLLAAIFPLFAGPMVDALGFSVCLSIFAAVAALLGVVPWIVSFRGERMRPRGVECGDAPQQMSEKV